MAATRAPSKQDECFLLPKNVVEVKFISSSSSNKGVGGGLS